MGRFDFRSPMRLIASGGSKLKQISSVLVAICGLPLALIACQTTGDRIGEGNVVEKNGPPVRGDLVMSIGSVRHLEAYFQHAPPSTFASDVILNVVSAGDVSQLGPDKAKGVFLYMPGWDPRAPVTEEESIVQPIFITLNKKGYDIFRVNTPPRFQNSGSDAKTWESVRKIAEEFRRKGYKKVILSGQSHGAWDAIRAVQVDFAFADSVVIFAPAFFGSFKTTGNRYKKNASELYPELSKMQNTRLMMFLFSDDEFESEPRDKKSEEALAHLPHKIVAYPKGFSGHGSAWLSGFDFVFADCVEKFVGSTFIDPDFQCFLPKLSPHDHRWMTKKEHLIGTQAMQLSVAELQSLIGSTVIGRAFDTQLIMYLQTPTSLRLQRQSGYSRGKTVDVAWRVKDDNRMCFTGIDPRQPEEECYGIYRWDEKLIMAVSEKGLLMFRGTIQEGDPRHLSSGEQRASRRS
jgi:hypothetical protein